jgi:hypothetical protein
MLELYVHRYWKQLFFNLIGTTSGVGFMRFILFFTLIFSYSAYANTIWCNGKLFGVYINKEGDVLINASWRHDWTRICNVNTAGMQSTCPLWASYAATAYQNQLNVRVMYSNAASCDQLPTYNGAPFPEYFMLGGG